jgi:hypothetical protein
VTATPAKPKALLHWICAKRALGCCNSSIQGKACGSAAASTRVAGLLQHTLQWRELLHFYLQKHALGRSSSSSSIPCGLWWFTSSIYQGVWVNEGSPCKGERVAELEAG